MGNPNIVTKEYMQDPQHFADAFNYYAFDGRQVVRAEKLLEADPTELAIIFSEDKKEFVEKFRDVLKQCILMEDDTFSYLMIGIENQTDIHYAMPVKNMIYDALEYGKQVSRRAKEHKEAKDTKGAGFLSGFTKEDKLKPVITLVVYWGTKEWDAPRSLKEMFEDVSEDVLQFVSDYKVNLIVPKEIKDFTKFKTELGVALKYISVADQKEVFREVTEETTYQDVDSATAILLREVAGLNLKVKKGEKKVNMCKALQDIADEAMEKGRATGQIEGRAEGLAEGKIIATIQTARRYGVPEQQIMKDLIKEFAFSKEEAENWCARV